MSKLLAYLERFAVYPRIIKSVPLPSLGIIVVIPVFREFQYIPKTVESLLANRFEDFYCEVIFVVNDHERSSEKDITDNDATLDYLRGIERNRLDMRFYAIGLRNIRHKIAGVGHARKAGMDEAIRRFQHLEKDGIILCLDADCRVKPDYLARVWTAMTNQTDKYAASIAFEHELDGMNHQAILEYELHLRYFIEAQRYINLPFAFHTVGSSMAVRASAYAAMGGMNQRKAGEDFYFLQKFVAVNKVFEINTTVVYPSDRESDRVPFGTGKAIQNMNIANNHFLTYSWVCFEEINRFVQNMELLILGEFDSQGVLASLHPVLQTFLNENGFVDRISEIQQNTKGTTAFRKRFYQWYNAFLFMKSLHALRDGVGQNKDVRIEAKNFIQNQLDVQVEDERAALDYLRERQLIGFAPETDKF